jgi:predicted alpha/beta hydrolase family esterase
VRAALLVAPPDTERADMPPNIYSFRPIVRARLPFPARVVASADDPFCTPERARAMAADWGAEFVDAGPRGHLNAESGLGDWPDGRVLLAGLLARP